MDTNFHRSCVVPVAIPGKLAFDLQIYGVSAANLSAADKIEFALAALQRRGLSEAWLETVQIGSARDDVVLSRKKARK